jgi:ribokinase
MNRLSMDLPMSSDGIIVVGSINMDLVVQVARMPRPGETVLSRRFFSNLGGKGANQAVAAVRAATGLVTFLAALGDDAHGRLARETLAREPRLRLSINNISQAATGVALITVDVAGENMISVASGANSLLSPADVDALPEAVWRQARVLLASLEIPLATVAHALRRAKEFGLTTILNPAPATAEAGQADVLQWVDVLTPNEAEAATLAGRSNAPTSPSDAAHDLRSRGARSVIVTRGTAGCVLVSGDQELSIPARRVAAVDTTAAGDSFSGALAAALAEGRSLVEATDWAIIAAAISVTRRGAIASLPQRHEIEAQLGK